MKAAILHSIKDRNMSAEPYTVAWGLVVSVLDNGCGWVCVGGGVLEKDKFRKSIATLMR